MLPWTGKRYAGAGKWVESEKTESNGSQGTVGYWGLHTTFEYVTKPSFFALRKGGDDGCLWKGLGY